MKKVLLALSLLSPALSITAMDKKEQELTIILQDGHVTMSAEIALQSKIIQLMYEEFKDSATANRVDISFVNKKSFELVRPLLVEAFNATRDSTQHNSLQRSLALQLSKLSPEHILEIINLADFLDIPSILGIAIEKYAHYLTDKLMRPVNVKEFIDNPKFLKSFLDTLPLNNDLKSLVTKEIRDILAIIVKRNCKKNELLKQLKNFIDTMQLEQLIFIQLLDKKMISYSTVCSNPHLKKIYACLGFNPKIKKAIDEHFALFDEPSSFKKDKAILTDTELLKSIGFGIYIAAISSLSAFATVQIINNPELIKRYSDLIDSAAKNSIPVNLGQALTKLQNLI